jgi:hypothetical protein
MRGRLDLQPNQTLMLKRAARRVPELVKADVDMPWTAFDLAQTFLFVGDEAGFLRYVEEGIVASTHKWQPASFKQTLETLIRTGIQLRGLEKGMELLQEAEGLPD